MEITTNIQDCLPFGSVDFTKSTALSSVCGKVLQLRTCCLVSLVNLTLAKSREYLGNQNQVNRGGGVRAFFVGIPSIS